VPAKLTDTTVKAIVPPGAGSKTYWDDEVTGFGLRVHAKGARSFFVDYRVNGRSRRVTIGRYTGPQGVWTVAAARARAKELRQEIDKGTDPAQDRRERREAPTVADLVKRYTTDHLPKLAGRHNDHLRMLAEIGANLGMHSLVADIHGGDVQAMHTAITESGRPVRANRIMAVCSKMFSLSLVPLAGENRPWRDQAMGNPCKGIERNHEEESGRLYRQEELQAIATAIGEYPGVAADCVRLIMLTGCRPIEAMRARWTEFDAEPHTWTKPSAHTKQRKVHHLPLSPPAIQLVERLRERRGKEAYLFPGDIAGEHIVAMHHVWTFVRDRGSVLLWAGSEDGAVAGVVADLRAEFHCDPTVKECRAEAARRGVDLPVALLGTTKETTSRLYDCRHTFASLGAGGGLSLPIIGRLLGHTQSRTTQRYARHLADDPVREAAARITNLITGEAGGDVVALPVRRR
jgi:integrase